MASSPSRITSDAFFGVTFLVLCSLPGLLLLDLGITQKLWPGLRSLWQLRHLPEHQIGDHFEGPALLRGTVESTQPRTTPGGVPVVMYYAWVEDHYRSGRSTNVKVICNVGADEQLRFRQGSRTMPLEVFHHDEHIALLKKDGFLDSLPMHPQVALDLGPVQELPAVPESMRERCHSLQARGTLHYKEARLTENDEVTIVACQQDGILRSCPGGAVVSGVMATPTIDRIALAYGQGAMNWLRGGAVLLALAMGYLCSSLLKHSGGEE